MCCQAIAPLIPIFFFKQTTYQLLEWSLFKNQKSQGLLQNHLLFFSKAPASAKRAWDRAPYSWNMVNLFSFGCHVIDRACVRTRIQIVRVGQGRLSKGREGCLRRVLPSPHLLHWTFTIWSIDSCQNRIATDQYPMTISRAHVSTHRSDVICLETVR